MEERLWESWGWNRRRKEASGPRTFLELTLGARHGAGAAKMEPDCP